MMSRYSAPVLTRVDARHVFQGHLAVFVAGDIGPTEFEDRVMMMIEGRPPEWLFLVDFLKEIPSRSYRHYVRKFDQWKAGDKKAPLFRQEKKGAKIEINKNLV